MKATQATLFPLEDHRPELALHERCAREVGSPGLWERFLEGTAPEGLRFEKSLDLSGCGDLRGLPRGMTVTGNLDVSRCRHLLALPAGLEVGGRLEAAGCESLVSLPPDLRVAGWLSLGGCFRLAELPETIRVGKGLDVCGTKIEYLPETLAGIRYFRNVGADGRPSIYGERATLRDILDETEPMLRELFVHTWNVGRFLLQADAEVLDQDRDRGGERRLLRYRWPDGAAVVAVEVICPSTRQVHWIGVPPTVRTCHEAVAWTAGLEPDLYAPAEET